MLEIEEQAQEIHHRAANEAEQMLIQAEKEALEIIEKARAEAEEEAGRMIANAWKEGETTHILSQAEESAKGIQALAMNNFDRAVSYILTRVIHQG